MLLLRTTNQLTSKISVQMEEGMEEHQMEKEGMEEHQKRMYLQY